MNKRVLTGILAIILFFSCFIRAYAVTSYHEGEVEEYVIKQLAAAHIPGVSLSIVTSQKEIYSVAFGDVKETSSDLQIGALTRTFTTLAIMQLVEKGKLNLDDSVYRYVTAKTRAGISSSMTIKDLLSYTTKPTDAFNLYDIDTSAEELSVNAKFNLLGEVIEKVSGTSYASYIRENIAVPLDMQSTYVIGEAGYTNDIISGNKNCFGLPVKSNINYDREYLPGIASNGIISNVKDMGKYMQMYLSAGGKVISYNAVESIMSGSEVTGRSIFNTEAYYSMGWTVTETDGKEIYYCNGSVEDYTSAMFIIPSMDIGIVMLFNSADALAGQEFTNDIEAGVVSLVMGGVAKPISSRDYLMKHIGTDIIYFIAFVCALMPFLLMEVWTRWTRERFSVVRLSIDVAIHIILPTALIFIVHYSIAPWGIIKIVMPDLFFVAAVVTGLFYFGALVKTIAYFVIRHRGEIEEEIDEEEENAKEIQERKDRLRKRMNGIKEAEKDKPAVEKVKEEPEEKPEEKSTEKPEEKSTASPATDVKSNTEKKPVRKDNIKNKQRQGQRGQQSKPKRFVVTKENSANKNTSSRNNPKGNKKNLAKNSQKGSTKNNPELHKKRMP